MSNAESDPLETSRLAAESSAPVDPLGLRHRMPADALIARYSPREARRYMLRGYAGAAFCVTVLAFALPRAISHGTHWFFIALVVLIVGGLGAFAAFAGATSKENWNADDRLAIAVSGEGIVLPHTGLILWTEMASIHVLDLHAIGTSGLFSEWIFGSNRQAVTVYVTDADIEAVSARVDETARLLRVTDVNGNKTGFKGGLGRHMQSPSFADIDNAIAPHAEHYGIPVTRGEGTRK